MKRLGQSFDVVPLPHPSGASPWPHQEPGRTLLPRAMKIIAGHPAWRVSEQLELSEQAVWEMLHQGRLEIVTDGGWVTADQWLPIVMSWATWIGEREPAMRLRVPASPA